MQRNSNNESYLVLVQPSLTIHNYATPSSLFEILGIYLSQICIPDRAQKLIVFPETIGAWFIATGSARIVNASTSVTAMLWTVAMNPLKFTWYLIKSLMRKRITLKDHIVRACMQIRAAQALSLYYNTFSKLAIQYNSWIVAGSAFLPRLDVPDLIDPESPISECPKIKDPYSLYNQSFVFNPSGKLVDVTYKSFSTNDEKFIDDSPHTKLHPIPTPFGRLAVLICADCWFPQSYDVLKNKGVDIIVVPAFNSPANTWHQPWKGYSGDTGWPQPADVDKGDVYTQPLSAMWEKYGAAGRMKTSGAKIAAVCHSHGSIWSDMKASGQSYVATADRGVVLRAESPNEHALLIYKLT